MVNDYFDTHYSIKEPMVFKDQAWFLKLKSQIDRINNNAPFIVDYIVDRLGVDVYLSFYNNDDYIELKELLPADAVYLFCNYFVSDTKDGFILQPKLMGVYNRNPIEHSRLLPMSSSTNFYLYKYNI
jgi:hypothetical protein